MQRHNPNGIAYYTFDSLTNLHITHAISTRHGGVSPAPFHSLNLSQSVGDSAENVVANLTRLHDALGLERGAAISASQAQSDGVALVTRTQRGAVMQGVDALITRDAGVTLLLRYADCVPILLYDPVQRAMGAVHAGWRGTVAHVAAKTVRAMSNAFGTRPRDLLACIGPSIGPCCYRVGQDVIERVRAAFSDDGVLRDGAYFDLWEANARQLRECGVAQIEIAHICTAEHTHDFYSHRAEKGQTGRFGMLAGISGDEY